MKKIIFLFAIIFTTSFSIVNFEGINWGDNKNDLSLIFANLIIEPSLNEDIEILSVSAPKEDVASYKFFLKDDSLYKIRVSFDKETVDKKQLQNIYTTLLKTIGSPTSKVPIEKKVDNLLLRGNSLKFIPDLSTNIYFNGVDTINEFGKMIDSNLYLEYVDSSTEN